MLNSGFIGIHDEDRTKFQLDHRKENEVDTKKKPDFTSFSISIMDNNSGKCHELVPMYLERHPSIYARLLYRIGFKFCKWMNTNPDIYTVSLDGTYFKRD